MGAGVRMGIVVGGRGSEGGRSERYCFAHGLIALVGMSASLRSSDQ